MREIDTSELDRLALSLASAPAWIIPALLPVAQRAGGNIKAVMRKDATGHRGLAALPAFVEYDIEQGPASVTVEVGFRKEGAGNLANFAAFGTSVQAPVMDITRGLTAEVPAFMRWVAKVGSEAL